MIQYNFIPQKGKKPKIIGKGILTIDNGEAAHFWEGEGERGCRVLGLLKKPEIVFLTSYGIMIKGFEITGYDRGVEKYKYMEWYCTFIEGSKK